MFKLDIAMVPFRQKIRGTLKQLGIRLGRSREKYSKDITYLMMSGQKLIDPPPP